MLELPALFKGSEGNKWNIANTNEIGRLAQGVGTRMPRGLNTIFFIPHAKPKHKKATYVQIVCANRPQKSETKRVCWKAGGNHIEYAGNLAIPTANIITVKIHNNSTISTHKHKAIHTQTHTQTHAHAQTYTHIST